MSTYPASAPSAQGSDQRRPAQQRVLAAWVAEQAQTLDPAERAALDAEHPHWRAQAAQLIAEGLLAYVVLEMIAPDLAITRAEGGHTDTSDDALTGRLVAHLQDFIDYRAELSERGGLNAGGPCEHGHQHSH
ncbi:MAG: hypothetical protein LJE69_20030 [Thiohalocapsa sp.]|jgi:hypothetical protein|uniref:hypothetical protein n=1 Tax=Thiohalocapsa sp. TaxID=2497641 RepID=UPI0025DE548D|nr:hypothetical protein [Thiohalocapsa sp.]MCG6943527.1 hypothetical protein [Thiohalocapsa sp.]